MEGKGSILAFFFMVWLSADGPRRPSHMTIRRAGFRQVGHRPVRTPGGTGRAPGAVTLGPGQGQKPWNRSARLSCYLVT